MSISKLRAMLAISALLAAPAGAQSPPTVADLVAAGDAAWMAGRHDAARTAYAEAVRRDSSHSHAVFRLATLAGWNRAFDESLRLFRLYTRLEPLDAEGPLAIARTLAWDSRFDEALTVYDSLLSHDRSLRAAVLGRAQTLAWRGDLREATARYEDWLRDHPSDADAWSGLAAVLRWSGRPAAARGALRRALALHPAHEDARAQLRAVEADRSASFEPSISTTNDTDDNRSTLVSMGAGLPAFGDVRVNVSASHRTAQLATLRGHATTARAMIARASGAGRWSARGEVGATRLGGGDRDGTRSSSTELVAGARISARLTRGVSAGAGLTRSAFDETAALIVAGLATTSIDGDIGVRLPARLSLEATLGRTSITGGSVENTRTAASGSLRWSSPRSVSFAVGGRTFRYDREAGDGYFAPRRFQLIEASVRASLGREIGWALEGEAAAGRQAVALFGDEPRSEPATRGTLSLLYRWTPGVEWRLAGGFANVASPTTVSAAGYRAWSVGVSGRVVIPAR